MAEAWREAYHAALMCCVASRAHSAVETLNTAPCSVSITAIPSQTSHVPHAVFLCVPLRSLSLRTVHQKTASSMKRVPLAALLSCLSFANAHVYTKTTRARTGILLARQLLIVCLHPVQVQQHSPNSQNNESSAGIDGQKEKRMSLLQVSTSVQHL